MVAVPSFQVSPDPTERAEPSSHLQVVRSEVVEEHGTVRSSGDATYSGDSDAAFRAIAKSHVASIDLETRGLHPHYRDDAAVGAIIIRADNKNFILREFPSWWKDFLADGSQKKILHNAKFDLMWMIHALDGDLPYARNIQDTMLKSQLAGDYKTREGAGRAGRPTSWQPNDLASVIDRYLNEQIKKQIDHETTDWAGPWSSEMEEYMLEDIVFLQNLDAELDADLLSQGQERAAFIENETVFGYAWMTYNGVKPDTDAWAASVQDWKEQKLDMLAELREIFPSIQNFNSPAQIAAGIEASLGISLPNTKHATLVQIAKQYPEVDLLISERKLETYLKNWGDMKGGKRPAGFIDSYCCKQCFRFHPNWVQIGTETARTACRAPNLQQMPRSSDFRKMFVAEEGFLLASLDYSASEVLVAAVQAKDEL